MKQAVNLAHAARRCQKLLAEAEQSVFAIPLSAVKEILKVQERSLRSVGKRKVIQLRYGINGDEPTPIREASRRLAALVAAGAALFPDAASLVDALLAAGDGPPRPCLAGVQLGQGHTVLPAAFNQVALSLKR